MKDATDASVCVPEHPQWVVALMESDLDALLALDVKVIGFRRTMTSN
ncbi:MAG: ABC transporter substrate-binding protein [Anaerolineae bacterium]|nr:ABC transporter substrate-binding protein [Anaerolineae bacterium]